MYDQAHWQTVVAQLKTASGVLLRGSVLSAVAADGGKLTLTVGGSESTAFGVLLDKAVDTTAPFAGGTVTASVARAGSFRGPALIVGAGTDEALLAKQLRTLGIYTEGAIAAVTLMAAETSEKDERRQREEDEEHRRRQGHK